VQRISRRVTSGLVVFFLISSTMAGGEDERMESAIRDIKGDDGASITIERAMEDHGLKGLSVAVIINYSVSWSRAWGIKSANGDEKIGDTTAFNIASIAKPVTATLVSMLAERQLISLDAPVSTYLKRWTLPDNQYTRSVDITLRHLLSHTAGTTQHGFDDFYAGEVIPTVVDVLNGGDLPGTEKLNIDFEPGSRWRYSGGGYVIAQIAIEDHLGRSLAELAAEFIFRPLDMTNTTMLRPDENGFLENVAKVHDETGAVISTGLPICPQISASGLWSTPLDMAKLLIEIQNALGGSNTDVISADVAKIVTTEVMDGFGLGWALFMPVGHMNSFSHGGANTGTGGYVFATMEGGNGMVFFGNGPNSIREPVLEKFKESIIDAYGWRT